MKKPFSPAWWLRVGGGLLVAVALMWLLAPLLRRGNVAQGHVGAPTASAAARRSAPRVDVTARPHATITGHVLDPARKPVTGATVCAWASPADGLTTAQTAAPRCATSDVGGLYHLVDLFPATPLAISASAEGFPPEGYLGPDGLPVRLTDGEQREGIDFVLRAGGVRLKGHVNDVTGGGVAGALVVIDHRTAGGGRAMAKSDAKGEFSLWVAPGLVELEATAPGYAPGSNAGEAPGHVFAIYLVPGATLAGRAVLAGSETPAADAFIEAIQMEGGYQRTSTRTDQEGRFRIEGLLPGRYRVEATAEGREGYSGSSITLGMGETSREVVVTLDPAYVVRGRVTDKATGEPCPGGEVVITDDKQNEFSRADIEPDGWARMASVIPGTYRVDVKCAGHVQRNDYPKITVTNRDAPEQRWEVDKGASVRVAVVDGQNKPIAKASVVVVSTGDGGDPHFSERAEPDGTFLIAGLKSGQYQVIGRTADGSNVEETITTSNREERITLTIPALGAIDGVVEDSAHRPVADVVVHAMGPRYAVARSLDDGTFTLTGLPSGEYQVNADEPTRDGSEQDHRVKVTVTTPDHARTRITVARREGTIEGRVIDELGQPVTDAFLDYAVAQGNGVPRFGATNGSPVITDTDGHFKIESLADGEYNLRAYRTGGGEAAADHIKVGTRDVVLRLGKTASIAGVLMAQGAPVERFMVYVNETKTGFSRSELFFHAGGAFSIGDLPAGSYRVIAETPDGKTTAEVTLAEGEQKTGLTLTLALRGSVDGRLVDQDSGAPLAGMWVVVDTGHGTYTGADGRFHLEALGGSRTLLARPARHIGSPAGVVSMPVEVPEGSAVDVGDVRVPRPAAPAED